MAAVTSTQLANKALTEAITFPAGLELLKDIVILLVFVRPDQAIGRTGPMAAEISTKLANRAVTEARAF